MHTPPRTSYATTPRPRSPVLCFAALRPLIAGREQAVEAVRVFLNPETETAAGEADTETAAGEAETPGGKVFATCDLTGKNLTLGGDWYHKRGEGIDICGEEFRRRLAGGDEGAREEYIAVTTLEALGDERSTYDTETVAGETETGVSKAAPGFEPADSFSGARPNCVFKSGLQGLGYYATISREHLVTKSPHAELTSRVVYVERPGTGGHAAAPVGACMPARGPGERLSTGGFKGGFARVPQHLPPQHP